MCKTFCKPGSIFIANSNPLISLSIGIDEEMNINIMNEIGIRKFLFLHNIRVSTFLLIINPQRPETINQKLFLRNIFHNMRSNDLGGSKRQFSPHFNFFLVFRVCRA